MLKVAESTVEKKQPGGITVNLLKAALKAANLPTSGEKIILLQRPVASMNHFFWLRGLAVFSHVILVGLPIQSAKKC